MRAVGRMFAAVLGFLAAVIAAGAFVLFAKLGTVEPPPGGEAFWFGWLFVRGGLAASMLGAMAFAPAAVLILVTEIFSIRSVVVHVGAGGLMGVAATLRASPMAAGASSDDVVMIAAGLVGGFVYWLIAGRMAGLAPPGPPPPELSPPGR